MKAPLSAVESAIARLDSVEDKVLRGMGYFCGALFLLLSVYTCLEVIGRRYFGMFTGVTDEISGYALALGGSWAFAYALKAGGHVRVDILLPLLSASKRNLLDIAAMIVMAVFAGTVSVFLWRLAASSYEVGATGHSIIYTPQWIPQALMALGYSLLTLVSVTGCAGRILAPRLFAEGGVAEQEAARP
jgi:TRAP-type mannitol/chloroaromatic compound transport system permease small subunit